MKYFVVYRDSWPICLYFFVIAHIDGDVPIFITLQCKESCHDVIYFAIFSTSSEYRIRSNKRFAVIILYIL